MVLKVTFQYVKNLYCLVIRETKICVTEVKVLVSAQLKRYKEKNSLYCSHVKMLSLFAFISLFVHLQNAHVTGRAQK